MLSENAAILILSNVLTKAYAEIPLAGVTADSDDPITVMTSLIWLKQYVYAVQWHMNQFVETVSRHLSNRSME